jgi:hypothetical protein
MVRSRRHGYPRRAEALVCLSVATLAQRRSIAPDAPLRMKHVTQAICRNRMVGPNAPFPHLG